MILYKHVRMLRDGWHSDKFTTLLLTDPLIGRAVALQVSEAGGREEDLPTDGRGVRVQRRRTGPDL